MPAPAHGADELPGVIVDSYNLELRDREGFLGDRASRRAFSSILDDWRDRLRHFGDDPLGENPTDEISRSRLDKLLAGDDPEAAGLVHSAIEDFAQELATVLRRFSRTKGWQDTERVVVGGGFRQSRVGELAIGRAMVLLKAEGLPMTLVPIRNHPDEAGLVGAAHLIPSWCLAGHDGLLTVDIGGSNIRVGVVLTHAKEAPDLSKAAVWKTERWRHADDKPSRTRAVERLIKMLNAHAKAARKEGFSLAPAIGIGCPGIIAADGTIERGGQNLPGGNWESGRFNLVSEITSAIPELFGHETVVVMHNDAVTQGLSEAPFMTDAERWGVVTIGTGLGNARFTNRTAP